MEWQRAKTDYPDLTLHHLEALVRVRHDKSAKDAKKLIQETIMKKQSHSDSMPADETYDAQRKFFDFVRVSTATDFGKD